jgi:hypothetical protein
MLMVQGPIHWKTNTSALAENSGNVVNFNPPGTPYPYYFGAAGGVTNSTTTDTYPSQITGIVYCTGTLDGSSTQVLRKGVIIAGGTWVPTGSMDLTYDSTYYANPAPGFLSSTVGPLGGTWRRDQAP